MSASALRAMYSQETDDNLIMLVTIADPADPLDPILLADNFTERLTTYTTDSEIVYGVKSQGKEYVFLPLSISLPQEIDTGVGQCTIEINYVTSEIIELIRAKLVRPASVQLDLVLASTPDVIEASFSGFSITSATYSASRVSLELTMVSLAREPFPCYTFTPSNFPGLF